MPYPNNSGPFLAMQGPFPAAAGGSISLTSGTPTISGTEITFPATSSGSLVGYAYGVEFGIGISAGYTDASSVAGAAANQSIMVDIAGFAGDTTSVVNARTYYNADPLDLDPADRVYGSAVPVVVDSASISGTETEGQTLTLAHGIIVGPSGMTLSQAWQRCDSGGANCGAIAGETATTYVLAAADVSNTVKGQQTATNGADSDTATSAASGVIAASGDPSWANVVLLVGNDNAADGTATFDDQSTSNHTVTRVGTAIYDDAQAPTGMTTSILSDGAADGLSVASSADFGFGTGDFTIEGFFRKATTATTTILDSRTTATEVKIAIYVNTAGSTRFYMNGADRITGADAGLPVDTWTHVALSRVSGVTRLYVAGAKVGSNYTDANDYGAASPFYMGNAYNTGGSINGWFSNVRVTKGVGRYSSDTTITVPELPMLTS